MPAQRRGIPSLRPDGQQGYPISISSNENQVDQQPFSQEPSESAMSIDPEVQILSESTARSKEGSPSAVRKPCAECRRIRIKCDKEVPCSQCQRRGVAHLCPEGQLPPRQPQSHFDKPRYFGLGQRDYATPELPNDNQHDPRLVGQNPHTRYLDIMGQMYPDSPTQHLASPVQMTTSHSIGQTRSQQFSFGPAPDYRRFGSPGFHNEPERLVRETPPVASVHASEAEQETDNSTPASAFHISKSLLGTPSAPATNYPPNAENTLQDEAPEALFEQYMAEGNPGGKKEKRRDPRPHKCLDCGKGFPRPSALATHMSLHSRGKPYNCPVVLCNKSFAVRENARLHLEEHGIKLKPRDRPSEGSSTKQPAENFDDENDNETEDDTTTKQPTNPSSSTRHGISGIPLTWLEKPLPDRGLGLASHRGHANLHTKVYDDPSGLGAALALFGDKQTGTILERIDRSGKLSGEKRNQWEMETSGGVKLRSARKDLAIKRSRRGLRSEEIISSAKRLSNGGEILQEAEDEGQVMVHELEEDELLRLYPVREEILTPQMPQLDRVDLDNLIAPPMAWDGFQKQKALQDAESRQQGSTSSQRGTHSYLVQPPTTPRDRDSIMPYDSSTSRGRSPFSRRIQLPSDHDRSPVHVKYLKSREIPQVSYSQGEYIPQLASNLRLLDASESFSGRSSSEGSKSSRNSLPLKKRRHNYRHATQESITSPSSISMKDKIYNTVSLSLDSLPSYQDREPPYSYAMLILLAIQGSTQNRLQASQIISAISEKFPWYRDLAANHQKASIDFALTISDIFRSEIMAETPTSKPDIWWCVNNPMKAHNLLFALNHGLTDREMTWESATSELSIGSSRKREETRTIAPLSLDLLPSYQWRRPPYSSPLLILLAIQGSPQKRLRWTEICSAIEEKFPWYCSAVDSWKVDILQCLDESDLFFVDGTVGYSSLWGVKDGMGGSTPTGNRLVDHELGQILATHREHSSTSHVAHTEVDDHYRIPSSPFNVSLGLIDASTRRGSDSTSALPALPMPDNGDGDSSGSGSGSRELHFAQSRSGSVSSGSSLPGRIQRSASASSIRL